jgi:hypothetical protein
MFRRPFIVTAIAMVFWAIVRSASADEADRASSFCDVVER